MAQLFTPSDVTRIAKLANIPIDETQAATLAKGFTETMEVVEKLQHVEVTNVEPTHQVTGLLDVFRDDVVDQGRMFTQEQALANAKRTHIGFFVADQVIEQD